MKKEKENRKKNRIRKGSILLIWLFLWQAASWLIGNSLLFAGPVETVMALWKEAILPVFWQTVLLSLLRVAGGFLSAFLLGILLGVLGARYQILQEFLVPVLWFCKAVPVACFAVLLLIWWGAGWLSFAICFLVTLPVIYVNVSEGILGTDRKLLEMASVFKMPVWNKVFYIYRPAVAPFLESGIKTAPGMSIKAGVAAEVIGMADYSIGGEIYMSKIYLDIPGVFAWTAVVIGLGIGLEKTVLFLWKHFLRWKPLWRGRSIPKKKAQPVEIAALGKRFGAKEVLSDVTKVLYPNHVYCLMAPSGGGKTTLLHILAGLMRQDGGTVLGDMQVSMVFQEDRLCEDETALRNVEMVCADREKALSYLEELVPEAVLQPVKTLSGGMRRRVCIARALAADAEVLLFDEPFNGLDEACMHKTVEVVRKKQDGRVLVVATHHKEEVERLCGEIWNIPVS